MAWDGDDTQEPPRYGLPMTKMEPRTENTAVTTPTSTNTGMSRVANSPACVPLTAISNLAAAAGVIAAAEAGAIIVNVLWKMPGAVRVHACDVVVWLRLLATIFVLLHQVSTYKVVCVQQHATQFLT